MTVAKRKGRPRKPDKVPSTVVLGAMRVRPEVYEEIRQDAEKYGRSIAAQAERRVAHREPDIGDVGRMVTIAIEGVERRLGKGWSEDDAVKRQCRAAADLVLDVLLGEAANITELRSAADYEAELVKEFPQEGLRRLVHLFSGTLKHDPEMVKEMLQDWRQGRDEAVRALCSFFKAKQ